MVLASARETALLAEDLIARKSEILQDTENCSTIDGIRDAHNLTFDEYLRSRNFSKHSF